MTSRSLGNPRPEAGALEVPERRLGARVKVLLPGRARFWTDWEAVRSLVLTSSGQGPRRTDCRGMQGGRVADRGAVGGHAGPPLPRQSRRPWGLPSRFPLPQGSTGPPGLLPPTSHHCPACTPTQPGRPPAWPPSLKTPPPPWAPDITHITAHSETSPAKRPQPHCPGATMDPKSSPYGHPPGLIRRPGPAWAPSLAAAGASGGLRFRDGRWRGSPQASQSTASSLSCWPLGHRPWPSGRAAQSHVHARAGFLQRSPRDIPLTPRQEPRMDPTKPRKAPGSTGQGRGDAHGEASEQMGGAGSRGAAGPALCPQPPPAGPDAQSGHLSEAGLPTAKRL